MHYRFGISALLAFFLVSQSASGAGAVAANADTTELSIDGVSCGRLVSVGGGDPQGSVVVENSGKTALPKKHIGTVVYAPITVEVAFPAVAPILNWIGDFCVNRQTRKTLLLAHYDLGGKIVGIPLQATNTLLAEVRFPAFDDTRLIP